MLPLLLSTAFLSSQDIVTSAQDLATVSIDPANLTDLTLTEGKTFSIDIVVTDVADLAGFTVALSYETSILTASNFSVYAPFTVPWPSEINDTAGFVYVFYTLPMGTEPGISGTAKLVKIDFIVDALGLSFLDFATMKLMDTDGNPILHDVVRGTFANTKIHNLSITSATPSPTSVAAPGDIISIDVTISNEGDFDEFFDVTTRHSTNVWIENKSDVFLAIEENTTLTFTWDTTGLDIGEYTVTVHAILPTDNYQPDNTATLTARVGVIRDIAITNVTVSETKVAEGGSVIVSAVVKNQGNFTEDFTVIFRYDGNTTIGTPQAVTSLLPDFHSTLSLSWDTQGLAGGTYEVSAEAIVEMDDNRDNNIFVDGSVKVVETLGTNIFVYAVIGIVALVAVIIILRYALKARKPKPT